MYKSGDKLSCSNYRPISVLCVPAKILEKLLFIRVQNFLLKFNIFHKKQFGFTKSSKTLAATTQLISGIQKSIDNGGFVAVVFIDFRKAFDCVDPESWKTSCVVY